MTLRQELIESVLELGTLELRESQFGSGGKEAFFLGRREILHFENANTIDLRLTRKRIRALREELNDDPRVTLRGSSDWCDVSFRRRAHLARVVELIENAIEANE